MVPNAEVFLLSGQYPWLAEAWRLYGNVAASCQTDYELHVKSGLTRHRARTLLDRVRKFGPTPVETDPAIIGNPEPGQGVLGPGKNSSKFDLVVDGKVVTTFTLDTEGKKKFSFEKQAEPPPSNRGGSFTEAGITATAEYVGRIKTLDELLEACSVDQKKWRVRSHRINKWEMGAKNENTGEIEIKELFQVRADLELRLADVSPPPLPSFDLPPPVLAAARTPEGPVRTAVIIPDAQIGFRWADGYTYLDPMHDRLALDVVLQSIQLTQPETVVILGDMLDLAPWSTKFPRPMDVHDTTNPALWELYWWLTQIRQAAPHARIVYMEGNHEQRIQKAMIEKMPEASTLRQVGEDREILSIPNLLHLDELGIEYYGPYGAYFWLWDGAVQVLHGDVARGAVGGTARTLAQKVLHSIVYGHIHRVEMLQRRVETPEGSKVVTVMSPGCTCRVDGTVPGQSLHPDWQQGMGIARLDIDTGDVHMVPLPIFDGKMVFDGNLIQGRDRSPEISRFSGIPQLTR